MLRQASAAFDDQALCSQRVFRAVMDAMSRPGRIYNILDIVDAPVPLNPAASAIALALLDFETPFWLDPRLAEASDVAQWICFRTGAVATGDPQIAAFAFIADPEHMPPFAAFNRGSAEYPDRSATLVLQIERFTGGEALTLAGPGIDGTRECGAEPLPRDFFRRWQDNAALYPCGIDLVLASHDAVMALPRSTHLIPRGA